MMIGRRLLLLFMIMLAVSGAVVEADNAKRMGNLRNNKRRGIQRSNTASKKMGSKFSGRSYNLGKSTKRGMSETIHRKKRNLQQRGTGFLDQAFPTRARFR